MGGSAGAGDAVGATELEETNPSTCAWSEGGHGFGDMKKKTPPARVWRVRSLSNARARDYHVAMFGSRFNLFGPRPESSLSLIVELRPHSGMSHADTP